MNNGTLQTTTEHVQIEQTIIRIQSIMTTKEQTIIRSQSIYNDN